MNAIMIVKLCCLHRDDHLEIPQSVSDRILRYQNPSQAESAEQQQKRKDPVAHGGVDGQNAQGKHRPEADQIVRAEQPGFSKAVERYVIENPLLEDCLARLEPVDRIYGGHEGQELEAQTIRVWNSDFYACRGDQK